MSIVRVLCGALLFGAGSRAAVVQLPGMTDKTASTLHAGYVDVGVPPSGKGRMMMHYVAYESEHNPADAPTLFWYNGGPGASSKYGLFTELGPYFLNAASQATPEYAATKVPTPQRNAFGWSQYFNLITVDNPPPIGMSYCTEHGPSGDGYSCGNWTDEEVFKVNHEAVRRIMRDVFPQWLKNDLFISGESYAGVYIPGLINKLLHLPIEGLNLKGLAVGDGCLGTGVACMNLTAGTFEYPSTWAGPWYDVQFFGGHGQMSGALFQRILRDCPEAALRSGELSPHCWKLIEDMKDEVGGFVRYDLYDDCPSSGVPSKPSKHGKHRHAKHRTMLHNYLAAQEASADAAADGTVPRSSGGGYVCPGTAFDEYWQHPEVLKAFGIPSNINFFNADNGNGFPYHETHKDVRPFYLRAAAAGLRILTYEGDSDASGLSSFGLQDIYTDMWRAAGLPQTQSWRSWTVTDEREVVGGYVMEWGANVSHVTVRGSGHMVPLNKPAAAYKMIMSFVLGDDYPHWKKGTV
eukprot:TRINITY_DN4427_c0_g1_i1.p1 TRINITY_DN4427_c0_g1~~TRINITY_DN4427_c0_g1_i1.p1  ORF type:complete len:520 (+),score=157.33 TRINITY_DN4427_c0_g1_i1:57-1616(+)